MKSVLIATIGTRDLMFQIASGEWFNVGDDRMQNGEIIGEQAEVLSDLGLHNISFRDLTKHILDNISNYTERVQPAITGKIFNDHQSDIEKVYLIATDQKEEVKQREKDTLYTTQIIKAWIINKFKHLNNDNVTIIYVGQDGTNPSNFEQMFKWWRRTWKNEIDIQPNQPIWVCVKGGVGQTSEAARISGLSFYSDRILFFEVRQNTPANRNGIPSDYSGPFLGTNYLWDRTQQQALKLLESYDYAETYDLLEPYFKHPTTNFGAIPNLLKAGIAWNQGQFDTFFNLAKSCTKTPKAEDKLWMAYEQAYLGVIRLEQNNTTEAMLHSYRAVEGLLYLWAIEFFPHDIEQKKDKDEKDKDEKDRGYPLIKNSILQKYPSFTNYFNKSEPKSEPKKEVNLQGWLLKDLLNTAIPATKHSIDFQTFWKSAKYARNYFSHRLGGLSEKEVFEAWGKDITNSKEWQKRILNCINLVTGKSFKELSQASLFSQIHTQVVEAIKKQEI